VSYDVTDGRTAALHNSAFGTVFGVVEGKPQPVCDYAGFAPFGDFAKVGGADAKRLPIGPSSVIGDDVGFVRSWQGALLTPNEGVSSIRVC
jgi:hypothetical protein